MKKDQLCSKRSVANSADQLWQHSTAWKLSLLGAMVCTGLYVLNPPWEWRASDSTPANGAAQSSVIRPAAAATALPQQGSVAAVAPSVTSTTAVATQRPATVPSTPPSVLAVKLSAMSERPVTPVETSAQPPSISVVDTRPREAPQPLDEELNSRIALADQNCGGGMPMRVNLTPRPAVGGQIEGFLPQAEAMAMIPRSEEAANGRIDPAYIHNLRALFHPDGAPPNVRVPVLVPKGMNVYVGEHVEMVGGHASPKLACHYIPNLVVVETETP